MSIIMIDTDVIIDGTRDYPPARLFAASIIPSETVISTMALMEVISGCANRKEARKVRKSLIGYLIEPVTEEDAFKAIDLVELYWFRQGLGIIDALIAATAIRLSVPLYTRNQRHFAGIHGLSVVVPYR